ncbi:AAA family ATPase [Iamia sp. SCSIO 61187]|uniref:nuclease-related domain-containing DEAD/DEAH box helicase n=1 Tax=Iamia sp. SCSIO 61187 TaxID=2722752 RepID=UPI001C628FFA|nr:NERD domain-containing protein [Iamia sp. SCSIO 61187]QYG95202.1 AAA family ATPase [Iamia sp. SCSIO 61187]
MGVLVPEDFDLSTLRNEAERRVVEALRDGLTDGWLVIPHVPLSLTDRDREIDVVVVHPGFGVAALEVKGHRGITVRSGVWHGPDQPMTPQPPAQARQNAYALRDLLKAASPTLDRIFVEYAVVLPNAATVSGAVQPELKTVQVLTGDQLVDIADAVEDLMLARTQNHALTPPQVEAVVAAVRPDADFRYDPSARMDRARARLEELCRVQTQALERLDVNRRVVAVGAAGTGKTRLAGAWASRAWSRGERVLLTCYNDPLAEVVAAAMPHDEALTVGGFFRTALALPGMPHLDIPAGADHEWWMVVAVGHLVAHWHQVEARFDTIVVDEAQDFSPAWLAMLEALLDPDGPRRLLMVTDPAQVLHDRGFRVPSPDDGWTVCELVTNCRNSHQIARLLRRRLDGAPSPMIGPEAVDLRWVPVDVAATDAAVHAVGSELARLIDNEERPARSIGVLTFSSALRDRLRAAGLGLVRWEDRDTGVLGENVHRVKGLELDTVVLVSDRDVEPDDLLYVGVSRAVSELIVISPDSIAGRLGLTGG